MSEECWIVQRFELNNHVTMYDCVTLVLSFKEGKAGVRAHTSPEAAAQLKGTVLDVTARSGDATLAVFLTLMLRSKSTDQRRVHPSSVLRKLQQRKGRTPPDTYTLVDITPERFFYAPNPSGGPGTPRKRHPVRSHLRHFDHQTATAKYDPEYEHNGTKGWWLVVIPQHWKGDDDLGSVEHDYRVLH